MNDRPPRSSRSRSDPTSQPTGVGAAAPSASRNAIAATPLPKALEDRLGTVSDMTLATEFDVPRHYVLRRRHALGIAPSQRRIAPKAIPKALDERLGTVPDKVLAAEFRIPLHRVLSRRRSLGIAASRRRLEMTPEVEATLRCSLPNRECADLLGLSDSAVRTRRRALGIASPVPPPHWTPETDSLLGTVIDAKVALRVGVSKQAVSDRRRKLGIARFRKPPKPRNAPAPGETPKTRTS